MSMQKYKTIIIIVTITRVFRVFSFFFLYISEMTIICVYIYKLYYSLLDIFNNLIGILIVVCAQKLMLKFMIRK